MCSRPAGSADYFGQARFDIHVNVLKTTRKGERTGLDFRLNLLKTAFNFAGVRFGDNSAIGKHGGVGKRTRNVLRKQSPVEINGCIDFFHNLSRGGGKPPAPHFIGHGLGSKSKRVRKYMSDQSTQSKLIGINRLSIMAVLAALIAAAAIYVIVGNKSNEQTAGQNATTPSVASGLATGEMKNFVFANPRAATAEINFADGSNAAKSLADWKGKVVLLNLWATWCAPCRKEMPGLSKLQGELGGDSFEVVALSVDRKGLAASQKFLNSIDAKELALYNDETAKTLQKLKVIGLPATLLIDRDGKEVGRLTGPAEWDSADAKSLVKAVISEK